MAGWTVNHQLANELAGAANRGTAWSSLETKIVMMEANGPPEGTTEGQHAMQMAVLRQAQKIVLADMHKSIERLIQLYGGGS